MITPELVAALVLAVLMLALAILFHLCLEDHERRLRKLEEFCDVGGPIESDGGYYPPIQNPLATTPPQKRRTR